LKELLRQRALLLAGISYIAMALFHIPDAVFRHAFDKDSPAQFFSLLTISALFALFIAIKAERFKFSKIAMYGALALLITQFASLLMSGNLLGSLIGDAGRFVGTASTLALLLVSIFHSQFGFDAFTRLVAFYLLAVELVAILGIAQHYNVIELPGDIGVSSTLGNADFFAALIGTAFPLILFLALNSGRRVQAILGVVTLLNIYALQIAGPLQAYVDIALTLLGIVILLLRRRIPSRNWTLNARTFIGTFGVIIWAEFIFLMPFLGKMIPILGNDVQVKIRGNFWLAGMRQFFSHPFLGVGPDQYGNYYEQYRTIEDIKQYSNILSNDAHSASVQTLATTGIFGTLAFLFLLMLLIRSFLILWDSRSFNRKALFALGLYIFVYLTNSFVSPITLTNKYLFWAVSGFIIGQVYRLPSRKSEPRQVVRYLSFFVAAVLFLIATLFAGAQLKFLNHVETFATKKVITSNYKHSPLLPCFMYFDAEFLIAGQQSNQAALQLALDQLAMNPRCVSAEIAITRAVVNSGDITNLGPLVSQLLEHAPARSESLSFGMYYANRTGNKALKKSIQQRLDQLGLVYVPGKLG
jgi:O-antigen ligase